MAGGLMEIAMSVSAVELRCVFVNHESVVDNFFDIFDVLL